jgi:hypothetical protein
VIRNEPLSFTLICAFSFMQFPPHQYCKTILCESLLVHEFTKSRKKGQTERHIPNSANINL